MKYCVAQVYLLIAELNNTSMDNSWESADDFQLGTLSYRFRIYFGIASKSPYSFRQVELIYDASRQQYTVF